MSELWEHCDTDSLAVLTQLYWDEHGCYPAFWYVMKGESPAKPGIINAPDYEEQNIEDINRQMSQPPHPGPERVK